MTSADIINAGKLYDIGTIISIGLYTALPGLMLFAWVWEKATALMWKIEAFIGWLCGRRE